MTLGWIHYYHCDNGYSSRNLLVCSECGTQHAVKIAFNDWGKAYNFEHDVVIRGIKKRQRVKLMQVLRKKLRLGLREVKEKVDALPLTLAHSIDESDIHHWQSVFTAEQILLDFPIVGKKLKDGESPAKPDRLLAKWALSLISNRQNTFQEIAPQCTKSDENHTIVLDQQACHYCEKTQTLVAELEDDTCPHCHKHGLASKHH